MKLQVCRKHSMQLKKNVRVGREALSTSNKTRVFQFLKWYLHTSFSEKFYQNRRSVSKHQTLPNVSQIRSTAFTGDT